MRAKARITTVVVIGGMLQVVTYCNVAVSNSSLPNGARGYAYRSNGGCHNWCRTESRGILNHGTLVSACVPGREQLSPFSMKCSNKQNPQGNRMISID